MKHKLTKAIRLQQEIVMNNPEGEKENEVLELLVSITRDYNEINKLLIGELK